MLFLTDHVKVKQMRKTPRAMALRVKVLGDIPNFLEALWMMAAERDCRAGQHNRNSGTNRLRRTGGYSNCRDKNIAEFSIYFW